MPWRQKGEETALLRMRTYTYEGAQDTQIKEKAVQATDAAPRLAHSQQTLGKANSVEIS